MNDITINAGSVKAKISKNLSDYRLIQLDNTVKIMSGSDILSIIIDIPDLNKLNEVILLAKLMIYTGNSFLLISFKELKKYFKGMDASAIKKAVTVKTDKQLEVEFSEKSYCMDNEEEVMDTLIVNIIGRSILNLSELDKKSKSDFNLLSTSNKNYIKNTA